MGGCLSCRSRISKKKNNTIDLTAEEVKQFIIESIANHDVSSTLKPEDIFPKSSERREDSESLPLTDSLDKIIFEPLDIEKLISSDEDSYSHKSSENISRTITFTSEPCKNECKRKKSTKLSDLFDLNPTSCVDVLLEESFHIDDSNYHKIPEKDSFLTRPLTVEDVNSVLKNESSDISPLSPISVDFSILTEFDNSDEFTEILNNFTEDEQNYTSCLNSSFQTEVGALKNETKIGTNVLTECKLIQKFTNNDEKIYGQILNSVPKAYEGFRKVQKKERKYCIEEETSFDKIKSLTQELLRLHKNVNEYNQNILHQLVLSEDHEGLKTILECLSKSKTLSLYLDNEDAFCNSPFSYAIISGNVRIVKLLLAFFPKIIKFCYFKNGNNRIPILHYAFQSARNNDKENIFIFICDYLFFMRDNVILQEILETKDIVGLTILHYIIVHYIPGANGVTPEETSTSLFYIKYLIDIGANLESKCVCYQKKNTKVDALGQAVLSKYPIEIVKLFTEIPKVKSFQFEWNYVIDNISYKLEELLSLRTDISLKLKKEISLLLETFK